MLGRFYYNVDVIIEIFILKSYKQVLEKYMMNVKKGDYLVQFDLLLQMKCMFNIVLYNIFYFSIFFLFIFNDLV